MVSEPSVVAEICTGSTYKNNPDCRMDGRCGCL